MTGVLIDIVLIVVPGVVLTALAARRSTSILAAIILASALLAHYAFLSTAKTCGAIGAVLLTFIEVPVLVAEFWPWVLGALILLFCVIYWLLSPRTIVLRIIVLSVAFALVGYFVMAYLPQAVVVGTPDYPCGT